MACLDARILEALVARSLIAGQRDAALTHIAGCATCETKLRALLGAPGPTQGVRNDAHLPSPDQSLISGPQPAPEKIGPYVLLERVGEGGMGIVYAAYDPQLNRKVAIKLLRPDRDSRETVDEAHARLLREAQAMAKVDHANVVAIHEAGRYRNKVYLVMDFVEGQDLEGWLTSAPRGWQEILDVFVQAGRGLAAAHAEGVIHRDFKPENVLLDKSGRARVTDFGIAKAVGDGPEGSTDRFTAESPVGDASGAAQSLTRAGAVLGTLHYMAPERRLGRPDDPRSDQFSFAVALFEALYHHAPFDKPIDPLHPADALEPVDTAGVPRRVQRAVRRALAFSPDRRFGSMEALLRELAPRSTGRLLSVVGFVAVAALSVVATGAYLRSHAEVSGCEAASGTFGDLWNAKAKARLRAALAKGGAQFSTIDAAVRGLDAYTAAWSGTHKIACSRAAVSQGEETPLLELTCLRRQRAELEALLSVLLSGDRDIAANAGAAVAARIPPGRCSDERTLARLPKPPADPATAREVEALRVRVAAAEVESVAGKPKEAAEALEGIVARARALGYGPLEAEALYSLGLAQSYADDFKAMVVTEQQAMTAAEAANEPEVAARAAARLALDAKLSGHLAQAKDWNARSRAALERIGGDDFTEAVIENTEAMIADGEGRYDDEVSAAQRAYALLVKTLGPTHPRTISYRSNLMGTYDNAGRYAEAVQEGKGLFAQWDATLGETTQEVQALALFGDALIFTGRLEAAQGVLARSQAMLSRFPKDANAGSLHLEQAILNIEQGDVPQALAFAQASAREYGRAYGEAAEVVGTATSYEGQAYLALGLPKEAKAAFERAAAIIAKADGPETLTLVDPVAGLAAADVALKDPAAAIPLAEQALALALKQRAYPGQTAMVRATLARALAAQHRDPTRVNELADAAHDELVKVGWRKRELAELEAWMKRSKVH